MVGRWSNSWKVAGLTAALLWALPAGAQDSETVVSGLSIVARRVAPIPDVGDGAPALSVDQLDSYVCKARSLVSSGTKFNRGRASFARLEQWATWASAERARTATEQAQLVRRDAAEGKRSSAEVEAFELARQKAVKAYQNQFVQEQVQRNPQLLLARNTKDTSALFADLQAMLDTGVLDGPVTSLDVLRLAQEDRAAPGFAFDHLSARYAEDDGRDVLVVEGSVRNLNDRSALMPALQLTMLDRAGFVLDTERADVRPVRLAAGQVQGFSYRMARPPSYAHNVRVSVTQGPQRLGGRFQDLRCDRRAPDLAQAG